MADLGRGVLAGLIATLTISLIMILRLSAGIMNEYNPIEIINLTAHELFGTTDSRLVGWPLHFIVGTAIWGIVFPLVQRLLPGRGFAARGLWFGTLAWLVVMVTVFPLAGSGFFAMGFGVAVPVMTLIGHWVYGLVLGGTYGWLKGL